MNKHRLLGILMLVILYGAVLIGGSMAIGFWPAFATLNVSILFTVWIGITATLLAKKPNKTEPRYKCLDCKSWFADKKNRDYHVRHTCPNNTIAG